MDSNHVRLGLSLSITLQTWPNSRMDTPPEEKNRRPKITIVAGSLLLLLAASLAAGWFYFLAPIRHRANRNWMERHSELGRWKEEQEMYRRTGSSPDLMFRPDKIGLYGDKTWFKWLLDHVNEGSSSFRVCGCTYSCLTDISNHSFNSDKQWNDWYEAHKHKSHEQWLQDGFAKRGVTIALPPSPADTELLLSLLGKLSDDPKRTNYKLERDFDAPGYVRYNAFRWLRDMGFDPVTYLMSHATTKLRPELIEGIKQYRKLELRFPQSNSTGLLAFADGVKSDWDNFSPRATQERFGYIAILLMAGFSVGGLFLIRRGIRTLHLKSTPASLTSHPPDTADDRQDH